MGFFQFSRCIGVVICVSCLSSGIISANLVAYYDFEPPDTTADNQSSDRSGNGYDASLVSFGTGAFAYVTDAPAALTGVQSLQLVEEFDSVTPVHNSAKLQRTFSAGELDLNSSWSVSLWFLRAADTDDEDFLVHMGNGDGFGGGNELYLYANSTSNLTLHNYAADNQNISLNTSLATRDIWHHAAVVHDAVGGEVRFYLNGGLVGTDSTFVINALSQVHPVVFGGHTSSTFQTGRYLDGSLDDVALWNEVLDDTAIARLATGISPLDVLVPEPGSLSLLLLGLVLMPLRRRFV